MKNKNNKNHLLLHVFTDGGSRGNPGESAIGVVIEDKNKDIVYQVGKRIGYATNNVAEYSAVISALQWLHTQIHGITKNTKIICSLDSLLACSQINGIYKVKNPFLQELLFKIRELESTLPVSIEYRHIARELNKKADRLVNMALDNRI